MQATPLHPKALTKLPDMAVYGPGVAGSVKRKTLVTVPPIQGSTFKPTSQRIVQIFLPKNGFLNGVNSYLTFTHRTTAEGGPWTEWPALSTSASNWIQRLRIKVGGRIVEDIDDYNVLHEILHCSVVTQPYEDSLLGQCEGYEPRGVKKCLEICNSLVLPDTVPQSFDGANWVDVPSAAAAATANTLYVERNRAVRGGVAVNANRSGTDAGDDVANGNPQPADATHTLQRWGRIGKKYQIKFVSGFLESRRYLPLRFMPPVEIELTLSDFARSHVWQPQRQGPAVAVNIKPKALSTGISLDLPPVPINAPAGQSLSQVSYEITDINYMAEMLEFDETFYQAFELSLAQGVTIPYTTFTNHAYAHSGNSSDIQIAERVRSAKSLFAVMRRNNDLAYPAYPKFMFSQNGLESYQVKVGTQYFPMQPVECTVPGNVALPGAGSDLYNGTRLLELSKCISAMADTTHAMTVHIDNHQSQFVLGIDLDREFNRLSGLDTTKGLPLYLTLKHNTAQGGGTLLGKACALNVFVHYDMFVDLFPGEVIEVLN